MSVNRATRRAVGVVCCLALISGLVAAPAAAQSGGEGEGFRVEIDADGNADVSVTYAYDLSDDEETGAFEALSRNETVGAEFADRFESRMRTVAERSAARTGRKMSVRNAAIGFERDEGIGLVALSVRWRGLAAVDGGTLTVTEPFTSGFSTDRPLAVSAPDGYEITAATPTPTAGDGSVATWDAGTALDGFELTAERTREGPTDEGTENAPGFTVAVAAAALLGVASVRYRYR